MVEPAMMGNTTMALSSHDQWRDSAEAVIERAISAGTLTSARFVVMGETTKLNFRVRAARSIGTPRLSKRSSIRCSRDDRGIDLQANVPVLARWTRRDLAPIGKRRARTGG